MTEETAVNSGGNDISVVSLPADAPESFDSEHAAAKYFATLHEKKPAESAEPATAEQELSGEDNAGPEEVPSEAKEDDAAETLPPVDPPRSWTKEARERWNTIPREAQEEFARIELGREREFLRAQQDAAEKLKGLTAKEQQAEQVRQQYETQLPALVQALLSVQAANFSDIKTMEDVKNLQRTDPFRYQEWDVHQKELAAVMYHENEAKQRQAQEKQGKRASYEAQENARLIELVPEMADPKKAGELRERAIAMLTDDLGLKNDVLTRWMQDDTGHEILSNAGIQKLIADGLKYRDIQKAPKAVVKPDLPPVQRPGSSRPAGANASERAQALDKSLTNSGDLKDAVALLQARRGRRSA